MEMRQCELDNGVLNKQHLSSLAMIGALHYISSLYHVLLLQPPLDFILFLFFYFMCIGPFAT